MSKSKTQAAPAVVAQRLPAEQLYAAELARLLAADSGARPEGWRLSPAMVRTFILGSEGRNIGGEAVQRKIFGNDDVVERSIVTLVGQRGLMLVGEPGTAKSLLSELLAAAICADSTLAVQGSAAVVEESIRYGWNYALLLRSGPGPEALVPGPLHRAMSRGALLRFEEISRCAIEVQDNLIPILSERLLHIPEMQEDAGNCLLAKPGFNVIATANLRDRGVNDMSSALKRRFNFETMRPLARLQDQKELLLREVNRQLADQQISTRLTPDVAELLVSAFQELRAGSAEGVAFEPPSTVLSSAEAIAVAFSAAVQCHYFAEPEVRPQHLARFMVGTVIKDDEQDSRRFRDYLRVVRRVRANSPQWQDFADSQDD
jgi:MoxR-like ATPase